MAECFVGSVANSKKLISTFSITDSVACPNNGTNYNLHTISGVLDNPQIIVEITGTATWNNIPQYYAPVFSIELGSASSGQLVFSDSVRWDSNTFSKQVQIKRIMNLGCINQYQLGAAGYNTPLSIRTGANGYTPCTISYALEVKIFSVDI